jgi:hypothetical protein
MLDANLSDELRKTLISIEPTESIGLVDDIGKAVSVSEETEDFQQSEAEMVSLLSSGSKDTTDCQSTLPKTKCDHNILNTEKISLIKTQIKDLANRLVAEANCLESLAAEINSPNQNHLRADVSSRLDSINQELSLMQKSIAVNWKLADNVDDDKDDETLPKSTSFTKNLGRKLSLRNFSWKKKNDSLELPELPEINFSPNNLLLEIEKVKLADSPTQSSKSSIDGAIPQSDANQGEPIRRTRGRATTLERSTLSNKQP